MNIPMTFVSQELDAWFEVSEKHLPEIASEILSFPYTVLKGYDPNAKLKALAFRMRDRGPTAREADEFIELLADLRVVAGLDGGLKLKIARENGQ